VERETGLPFGTIDSWLIFKLSGAQAHVTDGSNAGRPRDWAEQRLAGRAQAVRRTGSDYV